MPNEKLPAIKVALIEDDIAIVQMYRRKFEFVGFVVESAGDGMAGLKLIQDWRPDIVMLDLMMPNMDGETMLRELRALKINDLPKIVVLTNKGDNPTAGMARLGVDDYIIKAEMTPKEVADRITKLVRG